MKSRSLIGAGLIGLSVLGYQAGAQDSSAPLFGDGPMLRPLVQDVLQGSALVAQCAPEPDDPLLLTCLFDASGEVIDIHLEDLLNRLQGANVDPKAEILRFANSVLIQGDPDRIYPQRTHLRPLVRGLADVARSSDEDRLPDAALFLVPGFPKAVAFAVRDDAATVHLVQRADDPSLGYTDFSAIMTRARSNARWLDGEAAQLKCGTEAPQRFCRVDLDGFYEPSLVLDPAFPPWLAARISVPSLVAIPTRDELLIAPLDNREAVTDLHARLRNFRAYAITNDVAFWDGTDSGSLEPVEKWSMRGGLWLRARVVVHRTDASVLSFDF